MNDNDKNRPIKLYALIIGILTTLCAIGGMFNRILVIPGDIPALYAVGLVVSGVLLSVQFGAFYNVMHNAGKTPNREVNK